jgi:hypothetical protein
MGISWGRMYDGQSFGSPSRNVLLQVDQMATRSLDTTFHHGWMIGAHGINVGLTNSVWDQGASGSGPGNSVIEVGLGNDPGAPPRDPSDPPHLYAWGEVAGCVSVDRSRCVECSVLLDTGMMDRTDAVMKKGDHASIRMPRDIVRTLQRDGTRLKEGQAVIIRLGRPGTTLTDLEAFTYPHSPWPDCDITPAYSDVYEDAFHTPPRFPFANTGRHVYRRWSTGYDPVRGVARFVRHSLADIPQLLDPRLDVADCMGTRCGSSCPCHSCRA